MNSQKIVMFVNRYVGVDLMTKLIFSTLFACCSARHGYKQPNVIVILGDDIGYNDVSWNNERIHTPFMDDLAKNGGVILDSYYTFPICTPSRAALLTGRYADRLGLQRGVIMPTQPYGVPLKFKMISTKLQNVGYATHMIGKWHLGFCDWAYTPNFRNFDSFLGFYNGAEENYKHCGQYWENTTTGQCVGFDFRINQEIGSQYTGEYSTFVYTKRIVNIINDHDTRQPLFMYIALTDTHFPVEAPQVYVDKCTDSVTEVRKRFCGAMAAIDESVANITNALKANGLYENTVIIFASDNGGATSFGGSNYPLRGEKWGLYEGGTRVPAFVHSPLLKVNNYINNNLIQVSDWYPTILRLARAEQEHGIDGIDQWNTIAYNTTTKRKSLLYQLDVADNGVYMAGVRDERYKLIAGPGSNSRIIPEDESVDNSFNASYLSIFTNPKTLPYNLSDTAPKLFDLQEDPTENNNLADLMPEKVDELMELLRRYQKRSRPAMNIKEDARGNPANFNNVYSPGWCKAYMDTPTVSLNDSNKNMSY